MKISEVLLLSTLFQMKISTFLSLAAIFLLIILIWSLKMSRKKNYTDNDKSRVAWCLVFVIALAICAPSVMRKYMYPEDDTVFNNADYHVVEHLGFNARSPFFLVGSDDCPVDALYDEKEGRMELLNENGILRLETQHFFEPVFVTDSGAENAHLQNIYYDIDVSQGFTISRNDTLLYTLEIVPSDDNKVLYISSGIGDETADTSEFTREIARGYNMENILNTTPNMEIQRYVMDMLVGVSLVREQYDDKSSRLMLVPSYAMCADNEVLVSGVMADADKVFTSELSAKARIRTGFGMSETKNMEIDTLDDGCLKMRYVKPTRRQLRHEGGEILLTSSLDVTADNLNDSANIDDQTGVYLYNIFEDEGNLNHFNGRLRYAVGTSQESIRFLLRDYNAVGSFASDTVRADEEFTFQTRCSEKNTEREWVFQVKDMRATNALTYEKILLFVLTFVLCVCLRVVSDRWLVKRSPRIFNRKYFTPTLSFFEMAVYVVIIAFGVTRCILRWRTSTFVPLDDVGLNEYNNLRRSDLLFMTIVCCMVPLAMTMMSCVSVSLRNFKWFDTILLWIKGHYKLYAFLMKLRVLLMKLRVLLRNHFVVIILYTLALGLLYLVGEFVGGKLERIAFIFVPVVLYLSTDAWFIKQLENRYRGKNESFLAARIGDIGWQRATLFFITVAVFFISDAGFAVLFVIYSLLRVGISVLAADNSRRRKVWNVVGWFVMLTLTFLFIMWEGKIMVTAIEKLNLFLPALCVILTLFFAFLVWSSYKRGRNVIIVIVFGLIATAVSCIPQVQEKVESKGLHMKYRAKVQELPKGHGVDELISQCDFNSWDITLIMRSAQNQWFLNTYLNAHDSLDNFFTLQPHSAQGSPYCTQTTDVAVTRYVKAEHKGPIAELMLAMIVMLILIYCSEVRIVGETDGRSRVWLSGIMLLFVNSLFVYMSATNRTVFMGQDFPFLSLTSKLAVLLPCTLMLLASRRVMQVYDESVSDAERYCRQKNDLSIPLIVGIGLVIFAIVGWRFVPRKGADQKAEQFDLSKIVEDVSLRIDALDETLYVLQEKDKSLRALPYDEMWNAFKELAPEKWESAIDTSKADNRFFSSLMINFDSRKESKTNPEEFIHMNKRNGYHHLRVNKKFYFIESILDREDPWTGDLLAAETPLLFGFKYVNSPQRDPQRFDNKEYERDVLPRNISKAVGRSVSLLHFDSTWTADGTPLFLLKTARNDNNINYFDIESDKFVYHGYNSTPQMATRIYPNDLILVNQKVGRKDIRNLLAWRYGRDNHRYLAKNIWINGRRQLFYPLGRESMWSYQMSNLVRKVYGSNLTDTSFRHRSLRVSIDYDLHKAMYKLLDKINSNVVKMSTDVMDNLTEYLYEQYSVKQSRTKRYYIYYDAQAQRFRNNNVTETKSDEVDRVINVANNKLKKYKGQADSTDVDYVLNSILLRKYSYSAVAIDGNGRIRLLFDYTRRGRKVDPNNIRHFNKVLSDMYRNGSSDNEREMLGNLAIQYLNPGPGSTFKPIVYTSVTSEQYAEWNSLNVIDDGTSEAAYVYTDEDKKNKAMMRNTNPKYAWYGGVEAKYTGVKFFSIAGGSSGLSHDSYLRWSNNRYHSLIVLLGMQPDGGMNDIIGDVRQGPAGFPRFHFNGSQHSFKPEVWWGSDDRRRLGQTIMDNGLSANFNLNLNALDVNDRYANYYGSDSVFTVLYNQDRVALYWAFPEKGTLHNDIRMKEPWISNAFLQMVSGSSPLSVTPLQMAIMAMRLTTLNRAPEITTLNDAKGKPAGDFYQNFDVHHGWNSIGNYFNFYKNQVLEQLYNVPRNGTAKGLKTLAAELERDGLYMYAKTGTLNMDAAEDVRIKHLMVVIADKKIHEAQSLNDLRSARYYVVYMSLRNVEPHGFDPSWFGSQIKTIVNSEIFKAYMFEGK